jgi:uncharacterized protein YegP (UPF0339 family)
MSQRDSKTGRWVSGSREMRIKLRGKLIYHWVLVARNGEVLATSETYFSKGNALRAAAKLSRAINVDLEI